MEQSFSDISLYHEYRSARETEHLVSQKTWDDLNLDDFFEWADRTSSCVGRQYLYDVLHYNRLSEISEQEEVIRKLSADKELRAEIRSGVAENGYAGCLYHCIAILHFPSRVFPPLLPFADYLAIRAFCFVGNSLHYVFALCFGDFVHIGIGEHGTALSQQGADSGLFLFHSSVMAVAQASGRSWHRFRCVHPCIGISKRLCRHCIRCERNFPLSVSVSDWRATSPFSLISSPR